MTLVVAGTGGDSGKTLVSLGLAAAWRQRGVEVRAFKKGPDYIDAAWLTRAAGRPARNLDEWMMGPDAVRQSFLRHAAEADVCLIEGNRGLFDGLDGTSTAALARRLGAPILLVLDVTKTTRTAAAFVAGCRAIEPDLPLAGVVLNRVGGARHEEEVRSAIAQHTGIPVLGAIPRLKGTNLLPDRHLGLVPPEEHGRMDDVIDRLSDVICEHVQVDALLALAKEAMPVRAPSAPVLTTTSPRPPRVRAGWFHDAAFTFYYPENLEALEDAGAELVPISALGDERLPPIDLLYVGGGFPETHAALLAENRSMLRSVRDAARAGLPIFAECGGLIYLSRSVRHEGRRHELAGVFDVDIEVMPRPQGHGYVEAVVDRPNPFFEPGTVLRGHEFHYGRIVPRGAQPTRVVELRRGAGSRAGERDGLTCGNTFASWIHLHALGAEAWAPALVGRAQERVAAQAPCGSSTS